MTNAETYNRIRIDRVASDREQQVWQRLRETYGRQASEVLLNAAVMLYLPHILEEQGDIAGSQKAYRDALLFTLTVLGINELNPHVSLTQAERLITMRGAERVSSSDVEDSRNDRLGEQASLMRPIDPQQVLEDWNRDELDVDF